MRRGLDGNRQKTRKKKVLWAVLLVMVAFSLIATLPNMLTEASPEPTIIVDVPPGIKEPGYQFTVEIYIMEAENLAGFNVVIDFDNTILKTDKNWVTPQVGESSPFLSEWGETLGIYISMPTSDTIIVTDSLASSQDSAWGEGTLFWVTFEVIGPGRTFIEIDIEEDRDRAKTKLWDPEGLYIDFFKEDGLFYTDTPKAHFTYEFTDMDIRPPIVNQTITFNATYDPLVGSGSYDPDSPDEPLTNYLWDFGDDTPPESTTDPVITHNYTQIGEYTVTLTITDNEDKTDTFSARLKIEFYDLAITDIKVSPAVAQPGTIVTINITVANYGTKDIYFNLTLYYGPLNTLIWYNKTEGKSAFSLYMEIDPVKLVPPAPSLKPGESITVPYKWNTTDIAEATYTLKANASITIGARTFLENVEDEINNQAQGTVIITSKPINIAVISISVEKTVIPIGEGPITITVTVENQGNLREETFSVALYYDSILIENKTDITVPPLTDKTLTFAWDTRTLDKGIYTISANASQIPNEMVLEDNFLIYSESIIISHPPTAFFTYSPSMPRVGDIVTFDATYNPQTGKGSYDPDGEITNYSWDFGDQSPPGEGSTVTHKYLSVGTYTVTLNVTDNATLTGTFSLQITIDKMLSTIQISLSTTTTTFGSSITINGTITPIRSQASVTLQFRIQGETMWSNLTITMTNATSQFAYQWIPPAAGAYEVRAVWSGDANTAAAQSTAITLTVDKVASTISITLSKEKVTSGSTITISGAISPPRPDVTVTIQIKPPDETWKILTTITTDSNGQYTHDWTPTEEGTYQIKASWEGDTNTNSAESDVKTVTVETVEESVIVAPTLDLFYVGIGIAILTVIVITAIYFLKIKRP